MKSSIVKFDQIITNIVLLLPDSVGSLFIIITTLGSPVFTLIIGASIALQGLFRANNKMMWSGLVVWATLGVGSFLKLIIRRERPLTEYAENLVLRTNSFPSGHSSGSMVAYGLLAYLSWNLLPQPWSYISATALACLIIAIGVSRVYLGAHYPTDVLAGWLLGGLALCVIVFLIRPLL